MAHPAFHGVIDLAAGAHDTPQNFDPARWAERLDALLQAILRRSGCTLLLSPMAKLINNFELRQFLRGLAHNLMFQQARLNEEYFKVGLS